MTASIEQSNDLSYEKFISSVTTGSEFLTNIKDDLAELDCINNEHITVIKAYAMCHYPEDIFPDEKEDMDFIIYDFACKILHNMKVKNKEEIKRAINLFKNYFEQWKCMDTKRVIEPFVKELKNFKEFKEKFHDYPDMVLGVENLERKLKDKISDLDPAYIFDETPLPEHSHSTTMRTGLGGERTEVLPGSNVPLKVKNGTHEIFEDIFWKRVRNDIREGNYACIIPLLRDIANGIRKLIPHNIAILQRFAETIDLELIQQKIDYKLMTPGDILGYMAFIVAEVVPLQSVVEGNKTERWWAKTQLEMQGPFGRQEYYLPLFFKVIINKLERTYDIVESPEIYRLQAALRTQAG